jgi:hypothetical protein
MIAPLTRIRSIVVVRKNRNMNSEYRYSIITNKS